MNIAASGCRIGYWATRFFASAQPLRRSFAGTLLAVPFVLSGQTLFAQIDNTGSQARQVTGISAGLDAYRLAEEQRQAKVRQQVQVNDAVRFWGGVPTSRGEVLYNRYTTPIYGPTYRVTTSYSRRYPYSARMRTGYSYGGYSPAYGYSGYGSTWSGFDPFWGDQMYSQTAVTPIVGYNSYVMPADPISAYYSNPIRQPIGQRQVQTGPNRWESFPVYSPEVPDDDSGLTPVDSPLLDNTPYAAKNRLNKPVSPPWAPEADDAAADELPPPPAAAPRRGPREF